MSFERLIRDKFLILFLICENLKDDPIESRANGTVNLFSKGTCSSFMIPFLLIKNLWQSLQKLEQLY
jgi:hypothetical protein